MASPREWGRGYARQALADFQHWQSLEARTDVQPCHRLQLLQMACEKLCKAYLISSHTPPASLQSSHGYIARPLPLVIRGQLEYMGAQSAKQKGLVSFARQLGNEIELANPAVDRNNQRPDNCEYPWEDEQGQLHSPLDWTFSALESLRKPIGTTFIKVLQRAIERIMLELHAV